MVRALATAGCVAAEEEADELLSAAARHGDLSGLLARRLSGEPLAWVTGTTRFCGLELTVHPGVYVPRWQSEALARAAARALPPTGTAVDLGTGAGSVARLLASARPDARVVATESDPRAAACARANGVDVVVGDLFDPLPVGLAGRVDVVVGVLPYVPGDALDQLPRDVVDHEPLLALDGGPDGLAVVARAVADSTRWTAPGGWLGLEVGGGQFEAVTGLFERAGYGGIEQLEDGDGDPRAVCGRLAGRTARGGQASSR